MIPERTFRITIAILIFIAIVRIASTYRIFSDTADEGMHLSAGLQVLSEHRYGIHLQNPPMPRVVIAFAPWLAGARWDPAHASLEQVGAIFFALGDYKRMLVLARVGTIVFFVTAVIITTILARRLIGDEGALLTAFFMTTQPAILGHAGLATVDVAGTAGFAVALLAFFNWLARPAWKNALLFGLAYGFAINCKFLCIAYVPIACAAILVLRIRGIKHRDALLQLVTVPFVAFVVVWACYAFSFAEYPAPGFWAGLRDMIEVNRAGFRSYAFGHSSLQGWWWYFPATLGLKCPIAFLIFIIAGAVLAWPSAGVMIAAAAGILAFVLDTHVDIGVRYILPIFVPLTIAAAAGAQVMLRDNRRPVRATAVILLAWYIVSTTIAHPDYLAYFNEFGGRDPSRYLIDSNLDWGQDQLRLCDALRKRHVERIGLALMGTTNYNRLGFPANYELDFVKPSKGWVAVSDHMYRMVAAEGGFRWLEPYRYKRIGKSIRLFYIP